MTEKNNKINYEDVEMFLTERDCKNFDSLENVKKNFSIPFTSVRNADHIAQCNEDFDNAGGFESLFNTLTEHSLELGQYPITSFIGYGALQQIAQNGMIRACVSTVADDITRKWITINCDDADKSLKLQNLIDKKYKLKEVIHNAVLKTGYFGGCLIYIDTGFQSDPNDPLNISNKTAELTQNANLKFKIIDPSISTPFKYNCFNPLADDYYKPTKWVVNGITIDASRLLVCSENEPPLLLKPAYNFLGIPQAQILWDYVLHFNECRTATQRLLSKMALLVVKTDIDAVFESENGLQNFDIRMKVLEKYRNNDSVYVCDKESEDVTNIQSAISGCTDIVRQSLELIASINRTPAVKLLGISPSGFNATGESDIKNYYDYISSKQELYRDVINECIKCIQLAEFGYIDESVKFDFVNINDENEGVKITNFVNKVNALGSMLDRQIVTANEVREIIKADDTLDFSKLEGDIDETDYSELFSGVTENAETKDH